MTIKNKNSLKRIEKALKLSEVQSSRVSNKTAEKRLQPRKSLNVRPVFVRG